MKFNPKPYQNVATNHLLSNCSAALFVGCGLGKTASTLAAINDLFHDLGIRGVLVIAPLRVANLTWTNEVNKWDEFSWMRVANLRTKEGQEHFRNGTAHIYTINYEGLPKFVREHLEGNPRKLPVDVIVWDELTKAKNYKGKRIYGGKKQSNSGQVTRYKGIYQFLHKFKRRWGLTGTPIPNSYLELFSQIKVLDRGKRLGNSYSHYRDTYFYPTDYQQHNWVPKPGSETAINNRIANIVLTLRSSDYLRIPDVHTADLEVALPSSAKASYLELEKELFTVLEGGEEVDAKNAAVLVNKLRQVTSGSIYDETGKAVFLHNAKAKAVQSIVKDKKPTLLACEYRHEQEAFERLLPGSVRFSSATTHKQQETLAKAWNNKEIQVLIANPAAIGHGLNLQDGGSRIVFSTLTWSRELYDQLIARLARMGQQEVTEIFHVLCTGTIDFAVREALREKDEQQSAMLAILTNIQKLKQC